MADGEVGDNITAATAAWWAARDPTAVSERLAWLEAIIAAPPCDACEPVYTGDFEDLEIRQSARRQAEMIRAALS